jgi:hypothetical protein
MDGVNRIRMTSSAIHICKLPDRQIGARGMIQIALADAKLDVVKENLFTATEYVNNLPGVILPTCGIRSCWVSDHFVVGARQVLMDSSRRIFASV